MRPALRGIAEVVDSVGRLLLELRERGRTGGRWEGSQFKAEADRLADLRLREGLAALAPGIPYLSEEADERPFERPRLYWLADPLDGTASFAEGFAGFVSQVALVEECAPVLAVVCAPALGMTYRSERGSGAYANGRRLTARAAERPLTLADNTPEPRGLAKRLQRGLAIPHYLESGSLGLKICRVAEGAADLFVKDVVVRDWDLAPAQLILEEAGGVLTDFGGRRLPYAGAYERRGLIAASNPAVHGLAAAWLRSASCEF